MLRADIGNLYSVATTGGTVTDHGTVGYVSNFTDGASLLSTDGTLLFLANAEGNGGIASLRAFTLAGAAAGSLPSLSNAFGPTSDGTNVFVGTFENLRKAPVDLSVANSIAGPSEFMIGSFTPTIVATALDANDVYFAANDNPLKKGAIFRKSKAGTGTVTRVANLNQLVKGLAVDGTHVYFNACQPVGQGGVSCTMNRALKSATDATPDSLGPSNGYDVVQDDVNVYYGEGKNIRRIKKRASRRCGLP